MDIVKLKDLTVDGKGTYGVAAPAVEYQENLPTYLRITDILDDGTLNLSELKSVKVPDSERYMLRPNDIVFARTGGSTGRNYFYDGTDGAFVYAGFLIKFSLDPKKVNPKFIKYFCQSEQYKQWVRSFNTGSTRGNINAQTFGNMEIALPGRKQQDHLVSVLESMGKKIKLNKKINDNLYAQAKAIFSNYFINIDTIPTGWEKGSLLDIASYLNGLAMQQFRPDERETGIPVLKIKELRQGFCDADSELCSPGIKSEYIIKDGDVVFSWSGSLLVDIWCGGTCGLNQHLFKVTSKVYDKWFYYLWTAHHLDRFIAIAADKATTMGHIKREELAKAEVLIPSNIAYQNIRSIMNPIFDLIISNRIEAHRLAALRDELLPKLMSGELDVSSIKI
jgi:type I restriction enzyme S subunit